MTRSKRFSMLLIAVSLTAIIGFYLNGCQSTSLVQKTAQARTAYTGVIDAVTFEISNGRIKVDDWKKYGEPARQVARGALDAMDAAATKDPAQWQAAFDAFNKALANLNTGKSQAESASPQQSFLDVPFSPMCAQFDFTEVAALVGIGMATLQKMIAEGRKQTTEEETAQLLAAREAQQAADDRLDTTIAEQEAGDGNA